MIKLADLKNKHLNKTLIVVGKGASLKDTIDLDCGDNPIMPISSAIAQVEKWHSVKGQIYSIQQDGCLGYPFAPSRAVPGPGHVCAPRVVRPKKESTIVLLSKSMSPYCLMDWENRIVVDYVQDIGLVERIPSAHVAIYLAKYFGCASMVFVAFDAVTRRDYRTYEPQTDTIEMRGNRPDLNEEAYGGIARDLKILLEREKMPNVFLK